MNSRHMAELAALVSAHGEHLIQASHPVPDEPLQAYWQASRSRTVEWSRCLNRYLLADVATPPGSQAGSEWLRIESVIEDVLASEILTRVFAATLTIADDRNSRLQAEPIARSSLLGHLETRQLALNVLLQESYNDCPVIARLNRFRRTCERWTDLLLSALVTRYNVADFCFDEQRARDFGVESWANSPSRQSKITWQVTLASLRLAFRTRPNAPVFGEELTTEVVRAVIACFPKDAFHGNGPFKSVLLARIARGGSLAETAPGRFLFADVPTNFTVPPSDSRPVASNDAEHHAINFSKLRQHPPVTGKHF